MRRLRHWTGPGLVFTLFSFLIPSPAIKAEPKLDFEFFRNEVQPILLAKRPGNIRCVSCHAGKAYSGFNLQPLTPGAHFWNEEESLKNFEAASAFVVPGGDPPASRFLTHPLALSAGGDPFHGGGKHFTDINDPEWQILTRWTQGASQRKPITQTAARILQTNAAGDISHIIDPKTNSVTGTITDVEIPHGVAGSPDGARIYLTNESLHTLDVIDSRTLRVYRRIQLSGKPNNIAVSKDGGKIYVAIMEMPGSVDIVDARHLQKMKTLPVNGAIHNVYVTPDGRFVVAGSIHTSTINVIDTATDTLAWTLKMSAGIRPMAFDSHGDGSTRHIYVQLSSLHGFAIVDFNKRQEVARIEHPEIPGVHAHYDGLQGAPAHGLGVSPDGKTLWSTSKVFGHAYVYSLPDLKEVGHVFVGQHPEWITFTPDSRYAYIGAAGDNATYVIETATLKEIAIIPVGQVPKRNATILMAID
jgi:YVTN family beta-propeller protein